MMKRTVLAVLMVVAMLAMVGCPKVEEPKAKVDTTRKFEAVIEKLAPMTVASMDQMGPYSGAGDAFKKLEEWAKNAKIEPAQMFGVYFDDPAKVKAESLKYAVCLGVPKGTKPDKQAGVEVKEMPETEVAATVYTGPVDKISEAYMGLAKWIADQKMEIAGPGMEFYSMPDSTGKMAAKVCFPVKPMAAPADTAQKGGKPPAPGR